MDVRVGREEGGGGRGGGGHRCTETLHHFHLSFSHRSDEGKERSAFIKRHILTVILTSKLQIDVYSVTRQQLLKVRESEGGGENSSRATSSHHLAQISIGKQRAATESMGGWMCQGGASVT